MKCSPKDQLPSGTNGLHTTVLRSVSVHLTGAGLLSRSLLANSTQSWQVGANGQLIPCQAPPGEELLRAASVTRGDVHASLPAIGGQV
ncbi:hypothetical protein BaRGS_00039427 [Batillaria attramentaria]|uniref:Uncharacterized protein n=1 Tax=Batillaria attramentaria TaxID=370345 RepID=A0ABD0J3B3_9CAEN